MMRRGVAVAMSIGVWLLGALWAGPAPAMEAIDAARELRLLSEGQQPPKRFANASFRLAVFSYQDPDTLGLGDVMATLASHELLTGARVSSIAVLRFVGQLTPQPGESMGYFDKVERLSRAQAPTLALWGMVRRDGDGLVIETYLQLPASTLEEGFQARLTLPQAMGGATLHATLAPDRLLLQRQRLPLSAVQALRQAASRINQLRSTPQAQAPVLASLPLQTALYLVKREGDWVEMSAPAAGVRGWVPVSGHCRDACAALLDAPRFAASLLDFMRYRRLPPEFDGLAADARQLRAHMWTMVKLDEASSAGASNEAMAGLRPWLPRAGQSAAEGPALGAIPANLQLLARLGQALREAGRALPPRDRGAFEAIRLPAEVLRGAAYDAAESTLIDPRNLDLLHNLHVLYLALGDQTRAGLAAELRSQAGAASRQSW